MEETEETEETEAAAQDTAVVAVGAALAALLEVAGQQEQAFKLTEQLEARLPPQQVQPAALATPAG